MNIGIKSRLLIIVFPIRMKRKSFSYKAKVSLKTLNIPQRSSRFRLYKRQEKLY